MSAPPVWPLFASSRAAVAAWSRLRRAVAVRRAAEFIAADTEGHRALHSLLRAAEPFVPGLSDECLGIAEEQWGRGWRASARQTRRALALATWRVSRSATIRQAIKDDRAAVARAIATREAAQLEYDAPEAVARRQSAADAADAAARDYEARNGGPHSAASGAGGARGWTVAQFYVPSWRLLSPTSRLVRFATREAAEKRAAELNAAWRAERGIVR